MKKKKWLSFLLAFVIAISGCVTALSAFAGPADVTAISAQIEALQDKGDVTTELTNAYKALSNEDKDSIDPGLVHKLYYLCYQSAAGRGQAQKTANVKAALGELTQNMKDCVTLSGQMQGRLPVPYTNASGIMITDQIFSSSPNFADENYRLQYEAYKKLWADATDYQRNFADLASYTADFIGVYPRGTYSTNKYAEIYLAEQRFLEKTPEAVQESFASFPWSGYSAGYFDAVAKSANDYNTFMNGGMSSAEFVAKVAALDESKLPNADVVYFIISFSPYAIYSAGTMRSVNAATVFSTMRAEATAMQPMLDFYDLINNIEIPADAPSESFNDTVAAVRVAGYRLAQRQRYNMDTVKTDNPDLYAKYESILALQYNDIVVKEGMDDNHVVIPEETVEYEMGRPYGDIITKTLLPAIESIVGNLVPAVAEGKSLTSVLDGILFTNANVTPIVKLLAGITGTLPSPAEIAETFLSIYEEKSAVAEALKGYNSWEELPADFDWGVIPGDFESFCLAFLPASGIIPGFLQTLLPNTYEYGTDGYLSKYSLGLYETVIIPVLEALGAENIMDSAAFTAAYERSETETTVAGRYAPLMLVLRQVYTVYDRLLQNPVDYLATNLPNLIYHLEDGCIFDAVEVLVDGLSGFLGDMSAIKQYLSLDGIFAALTPVLEGAGIQLNVEDIKKFAHLGKSLTVPTASMQYETTVRVQGNYDTVVRQLAKILEPIALKLLNGLGVSFDPLKEFVKVEAPKYPHNGKMGKDVMTAMIKGFDDLVGSLVNIKDLINGFCTQEMAATAITELYKLIGSLDLSAVGLRIPVSPKEVAKMLTEDKYKEIAATLQVDNWNDVALVVKNENTIIDLTDMGFKDGDRQGFIDCIVASLRPLVKLVADSGLIVNSVSADGTQNYGLYETLIIPLFEGIGLTPAVNSAGYTDNYNKLLKKADKNQAYDYLVNTILAPVLGLIENLESAPLNTLLGLLPNLAYSLQYSEDLAVIGNLLANDEGIIDLAGMINGLLGSALPGFELPPINLDALASCGEIVEKNSKSALHSKYTTVVADKPDAFVTLFYYIYDFMTYKDNMSNLKKMLSEIEGMDATLMSLVDGILNDVFTQGKEEALCAFGTLLASDVWECPDADGNDGGKTPSTGDNSLPTVAAVSVMFAAGAVIILLRRKKRASF